MKMLTFTRHMGADHAGTPVSPMQIDVDVADVTNVEEAAQGMPFRTLLSTHDEPKIPLMDPLPVVVRQLERAGWSR
jgi:hypothetical protein